MTFKFIIHGKVATSHLKNLRIKFIIINKVLTSTVQWKVCFTFGAKGPDVTILTYENSLEVNKCLFVAGCEGNFLLYDLITSE